MNREQIPSVDLRAPHEALETEHFAVLWTGFLFVRGCVAGRESVDRMLTEWRRDGPERALATGRGSFAVRVFDKRARSAWCAVDPFGLTRLYFSTAAIADDFFALVGRLGAERGEIDDDALAAFFRFGFYDSHRTLDRRIRVLGGDDIAVCEPGGMVRLVQKYLVDNEDDDRFDFDRYMRDVAIALQGRQVSADLTGGFDSRLVVACLAHAGVPVREAVTSGQDGSADVAVARKIAAGLHLPYVRDRHDIAGIEDRLPRLLAITQGQMGVLTYDHMFQIQQGRIARGMNIGIGGAGGELWKDFLWLQDFPRLKGAPDFERLYRRRFEPRPLLATAFVPDFAGLFESAAPQYVAEMYRRFGGLPRTAGYDSVYAGMRLPFLMGPSVTAGIHAGLPHFSPLLDPDGVKASVCAPVRERLFARWHRRTLARVAPVLKGARTTEGLSARTGAAAIADLPFYAANKAVRAAQKIAQRLNLPDVMHHAVEDPRTLEQAKALRVSGVAMRRLQDFAILSRDIAPDQLPRPIFERALTAGLVLLRMMP
jgi:hypothetical protein